MEYEMLDSRSKSLTNKSSRRTVLYTQKRKKSERNIKEVEKKRMDIKVLK